MTDVMRVVKNLFKLGLVALQYIIVYLNLDTRSSILREFVKSETPKVNEYSTAPANKEIYAGEAGLADLSEIDNVME